MKKLTIILTILVINIFNVTAKDTLYEKTYISYTPQMEEITSMISNITDLTKTTDVKLVINITSDNLIEVKEIICTDSLIAKQIFLLLNGKKIHGNNIEVKNIKLQYRLVLESEKPFMFFDF